MSPYYIDSIFFDGHLKVIIKDANKEAWSVELTLTADNLLRLKESL